MLSDFPLVSIHILNYNGGEDILCCLRSVSQLSYSNFQTVVIDNASTDNSLEKIQQAFPDTIILRNQKNLGFGAGHNIGLKKVLEEARASQENARQPQYVWLLNQDTTVAPDALDQLVTACGQDTALGAISPVILNPDNTIWFEGGKIDWWRMRATHTSRLRGNDIQNQPEFLSGCALFVRTEALQKSGLFDERLFLYYEDVDLSLRLKQNGFRLLVEPQSRVWHTEASNRALSLKTLWLVWSGLLFFQKHAVSQSFVQRLWLHVFFFMRVRFNQLCLFFRPTPFRRALARLYRHFIRQYGYTAFLFHHRQLPEYPPHPDMARFFVSDQSQTK